MIWEIATKILKKNSFALQSLEGAETLRDVTIHIPQNKPTLTTSSKITGIALSAKIRIVTCFSISTKRNRRKPTNMEQHTAQRNVVICKGQKIKKLMPIDTEPGRLVDCKEKVSFSYSNSDSQEVATNKNRSGNKEGPTFKTNRATDVTATQIRSSVSKMTLTLIQLMRTLDRMPEETTDCESPFFGSCSEQEANKQWSQYPNREVLDRMMKANAKPQQQLGDQMKVISEVEGEIRASQSNSTLEELRADEEVGLVYDEDAGVSLQEYRGLINQEICALQSQFTMEEICAKEAKLRAEAAALIRLKTGRELRKYMWTESVCGCSLSDITIFCEFKRPEYNMEINVAGDGDVLVVLDQRVDESLVDASMAREIVNKVQKLRMKSGLEPSDLVKVSIDTLESIHYCTFQEAHGKRDERIEESVSRMLTNIDIFWNIRERPNKPLKTPLREVGVVHTDAAFPKDIDMKLREVKDHWKLEVPEKDSCCTNGSRSPICPFYIF